MAAALLDTMLRRWLLTEGQTGQESNLAAEDDGAAIPFSMIMPTAYGQMILNRYDINQANALLKTGRAIDHDEIVMLSRLLAGRTPGIQVIDVGANFGTYTLGLAAAVGNRGKVHAFEPQRIIFNMLAGSVALNSLTNVYCYNMAVGARTGSVEIPQFDYASPLNFGSIEFGPEQREQLHQKRKHDVAAAEYVTLVSLDSFAFERVDLIKIDAEGMELDVLAGAADTIRRCRPLMYVEFIKVDKRRLHDEISAHGYTVEEVGMNFLCTPIMDKGAGSGRV